MVGGRPGVAGLPIYVKTVVVVVVRGGAGGGVVGAVLGDVWACIYAARICAGENQLDGRRCADAPAIAATRYGT